MRKNYADTSLVSPAAAMLRDRFCPVSAPRAPHRRRAFALAAIYLTLNLITIAWAADRNAEIGEVAALVNQVEILHPTTTDDDLVQIGAKLYVGDILKTGAASAAEIIFGNNARVRLAGNSELRVQAVTETTKIVDQVTVTVQNYALVLVNGGARFRVRENIVTPTQLTLTADELRLTLARGDFWLSRAPAQANAPLMLDGILAWGQITLNLPETVLTLKTKITDVINGTAPAQLRIASHLALLAPPWWQPLSAPEAKTMIEQHAPFTADQPLELPREAPKNNREMDGA